MTKILAHRGFSGLYPENTKLAFEKAISVLGCNGIENDVHLTKDGKVIIIHDETLDRTCKNMRGYVKDYTLDELLHGDFSKSSTGHFDPQQIMTLHEYLELVEPTSLLTNIELKTSIIPYEGIEEKVLREIQEFDLIPRIIISSFNHYSVLRMKKLCPQIKCGLLTCDWIINAGKYVSSHQMECYHPTFYNCTSDLVPEIHSYGIEINTWTVNEPEDISSMLRLNVDAIITNFPGRAVSLRQQI